MAVIEYLILEVSPDGKLIRDAGGSFTEIVAYLTALGAMEWELVSTLNPMSGPVVMVFKK